MICPHFGTCGGCVSQDVPYPLQLERKQLTLEGLLRDALGGRAPVVRPAHRHARDDDGMPWRFRHKAAFVFGAGSAATRGPSSWAITPRDRSALSRSRRVPSIAERANRLAFALRDQLVKARIPAAGAALDGILRHVVIRTTQDETRGGRDARGHPQ